MKRRVAVLAVVSMFSGGAPAIEVHQAAPIRVVPPSPPPRVVQSPSEPRIVSAPGKRETRAERADAPEAPGAIFNRPWRLRVPGGAYQTENRVEGTRTLHVAPGSGRLPHEVVISPKGEYLWKAYGRKIKGRWVANERDGYPLTLKSAYEGKDWHATLSNGELLLWDGNSLAGQFRGK